MSSIVAAVHSPEYSTQSVREAVEAAIDTIAPSIDQLIKPGDRVALKPYMNAMGLASHDGTDRRVSHPVVITALVELLKDCGAVISLGDEGSRSFRQECALKGREWLYAMEARYGLHVVSFAKSGARHVKSNLRYPRSYLITKALLDVDAVVSCVNCRSHPRLLLMGAVRNMFNAVVGECQSRLYRMFRSDCDLARVMADVCGIVRPSISLLDMTTVVDAKANAIRPVGLILASTDPVAADVVAAQVLGLNGQTIWTTIHAAGQGLGCADIDGIQVRGGAAEVLPTLRTPASPKVGPESKEGVIRILARAAQLHVLEPRPVIRQDECSQCGDCKIICPVGAVVADSEGRYAIRHVSCANCQLCVACCQDKAIRLEHVGSARILQESKRLSRIFWNRSKIGVRMPLGPVSMQVRLARHVKVSRNVQRGPADSVKSDEVTRVRVMPARTDREAAVAAPSPVPLSEQDYCRDKVALVIGVGHGLGSALAHRFAQAGMRVAVAARNAEKLQALVQDICDKGAHARAYGCDAQWEPSVKEVFQRVDNELGTVDLVVYNVEHFVPGGILEIEASAFEECWRAMCLGGFMVGKEAAKRMVPRKRGTIIYTGATAATRGRDGYINLAVGKFGNRALAQSLARELGPKGIHVAHVIIDGGILSSRSRPGAVEAMSSLFPGEIANSIFHLYQQHPSAWSQEIDLRPWVEKF